MSGFFGGESDKDKRERRQEEADANQPAPIPERPPPVIGGFDNVVSNMSILPLVYTENGKRVETSLIWPSDDEAQVVNVLAAVSGGELGGMDNIELNGLPMSDFAGTTVSIYLGTSTQGVDSRYNITPTKIGGLRDTAYIAISLAASDKLTSKPLITVNVSDGIKVPRWNGSDWTTLAPAPSGNPAAVIRHYLLLPRDQGGAGLSADEIDDASFGVVYTWAEVLVSNGAGGTEPRARVSVSIKTIRPWTDTVDELLRSFGGFMTRDGRKRVLNVHKAEAAVQAFEEGTLTGSILPGTFIPATISKKSRPNRVVAIYIDPSDEGNDARVRTPPVDDYADQQTNPRGVVLHEMSLLPVNRQSQAIREATKYMSDVRLNWFGCTFASDIDSIRCKAGSVIKIKHPKLNGGTDYYYFRVKRIQKRSDHTRTLLCKSYNSSVHNDNLEVDPIQLDHATLANPWKATDEVTALAITEEGGLANGDGTWVVRLSGTFTAPNQTLGLVRYRALVKEDSGAYEFVKYIPKMDTTFNLPITAEVGKTYTIKIQTENDKNTISDGAESNSITIVGKDAPPSQVTGYTVMIDGNNLKHKWNTISDSDLFGYQISQGSVYEASVLVTQDYLAGTEFIDGAITNGTKTFWIVAVDNSGNVSTPTSFSINVTNADNNIVFDFEVSFPSDIVEMNNAAVEYINVSGYQTSIPSIAIDTQQQWDDTTNFEGVLWNFPVKSVTADLTTKTFDLGGVGTGNIILDILSVLTGSVDFVVEINTADSLLSWNGWQVFTPGTYTCRYFKIKISMTSNDVNTGTLNVYKINPVFDIIDRIEENTVAITDASGGLAVTYAVPFTDTPQNSLGTLELFDADTGKYLHPKSFSETKDGFTLKAVDIQTAALATGSIRYKARGYLLSENLDFSENLANIAENLTNAVIEYIAQSGSRSPTVPSITIATQQQWDDVTEFEGMVWDLPVVASQASFDTGKVPFNIGFIGTGKISVSLDTVLVGDVTRSIQINLSDDDITYNGWAAFTSGNTYTGKYFKFKFIFTSNVPATSRINYRDLSVAVSNLS